MTRLSCLSQSKICWSKGEEEMFKLIALLAFLLIIAVIIWAVTPEYEKCYSDREYEGYAAMDCCKGLTGGDKSYRLFIRNVL